MLKKYKVDAELLAGAVVLLLILKAFNIVTFSNWQDAVVSIVLTWLALFVAYGRGTQVKK